MSFNFDLTAARKVAKAIAAGVAALAAYLAGVLPAEGSLGDLSLVQWLAALPVVLAAYGITWRVPNQE